MGYIKDRMGEEKKGERMGGKEVESVSIEKHLEELENKNRIILKRGSREVCFSLLPNEKINGEIVKWKICESVKAEICRNSP